MKMAVFQCFRCFVGSPPFGASCWPLAGLLLASCWPLAGFLLASCWLAAGLLLACCWPLAGLLLATCWPLAGLLLASCWPIGFLLASCWLLAGLLLASCWLRAGLLLASSWPLAGFLLASSFPTRISLGNRFLGRLAKMVNFLHENGCFSWFRGISWGPPHLGPLGLLASCWPLAGFLLASSPLACLLLASCWPLAGLFLASCWPLAGLLLASCSSFPTRISLERIARLFHFWQFRSLPNHFWHLGASQTISGHLKPFKSL